jgi:hypothetical protein
MSEYYCSHEPPCCPQLAEARAESEYFQKKAAERKVDSINQEYDAKVLDQRLKNTIEDRDHWRTWALLIEDFADHRQECITTFFEAGRPTKDGGYETKIKGKWYQSRPVDKTPKCNCGLNEVLALIPADEGMK